jgi:hypothetical protein
MLFAPSRLESRNKELILKPKKEKSMRIQRMAVTTLFAIMFVGTCMAQTEIPKIVGNLDVYGIKKIQIKSGPNGYIMTLLATFTNANAEALRLRNGEFDVHFIGPKEKPIILGQTKVVDAIIPAQASQRPGQKDVVLDVMVGPHSQATVDKLFEIINMIGDPAVSLRIDIKGKSEVGMQMPRGWVYEQGKKFEVDMSFVPAVQREFVLK